MGDPLGIGPEIIVKAITDESLRQRARFRVYGSSRAMDAAALSAGVAPCWSHVDHRADPATLHAALHHDALIVDYPELDFDRGAIGLTHPGPSRPGGAASFRWVEDAIDAALRPPADPLHAHAIVTAPISKTSWTLAGHTQYPGHTELLADRLHAPRHGMLFVGPSLRVMLATIHVPLIRVGELLTTQRVFDAIDLAARSCREMGIASPRIGVCGLNPHAGEGGILGDEDDRLIRPAIEMAASKGIHATGPWPADTLFLDAAASPAGKGRHDCVVAMYHDQGLIPVKLLDRERAVNMTVGLPTVRTSPAHGTAFDIAGHNKADPGSMHAAIELAIKCATDSLP